MLTSSILFENTNVLGFAMCTKGTNTPKTDCIAKALFYIHEIIAKDLTKVIEILIGTPF
jgi:hypothetical protein